MTTCRVYVTLRGLGKSSHTSPTPDQAWRSARLTQCVASSSTPTISATHPASTAPSSRLTPPASSLPHRTISEGLPRRLRICSAPAISVCSSSAITRRTSPSRDRWRPPGIAWQDRFMRQSYSGSPVGDRSRRRPAGGDQPGRTR